MMDDIEKDKKEVKKNQDIRIYGFIGSKGECGSKIV